MTRLRALGQRWLAWLQTSIVRHPLWVLALSALSLVPAALLTARLEIRTSLSELLPESRPSVQQLRRVRERVPAASTLIAVLETQDPESLPELLDELARRVRTLDSNLVSGVDAGRQELAEFLERHSLLYADLESIERLADEVAERYDYEVGKRTGFDLGIVEEDAPPPFTIEEIRERLSPSAEVSKTLSDPRYIGEGGRLGAIVVRTPLQAGDPRAFELERRIRELFGEIGGIGDPRARIHFTGSLITSAEEHRAVVSDLAHVGTLGVSMILVVVFLFFLRLRVIFAIAVTIGVGCVWSFALASLTIGHLNSATGFLVSIIAGDGINFGVILAARFLEARARDGLPGTAAVRASMASTASGTLAAALSASVAYGALAITDFRGFRHFGLIAGFGMLFCWVASYSVLPALLLLGERISPLENAPERWQTKLRASYGRPFAAISRHTSRRLLFWLVASGFVCTALGVLYVARDPLEYDMRRLRVDDTEPTSARQLARRVEGLISRLGRDGQALLVDRLEQVEPLTQELERRRDAAPDHEKPFEQVVTILDLLPKNQEEKLALASEILDYLERARRLGAISEEEWVKLERELPSLSKLQIGDLPREIAWPFEEADGTRGTIVYLVPAEGRSLNDARYLMQWADSFREVRLPNGDSILGTGDPVLFADMLENVRSDAPKAMIAASVATFVVILVAFGGRPMGFLALGSLVLGFSWLVGYLVLAGERINFLNFVALPISVGIGADYAANVLKRVELEGRGRLSRILEETGGAVVLCSLTTLLGYVALTFSVNGAVRSFGRAAAVGEISMLFSAMLLIPAALQLRAKSS